MENEQERLSYGSHVPMVRAALNVLTPRRIIECGGGRYSTPEFLRSNASVILTIEHDESWREEVRKIGASVEPRTNQWDLELLPIPIDNATERRHMTAQQADGCDIPYIRLARTLHYASGTLLFVDCASGARCAALKGLGHLADIVILHDTQDVNYQYYHYPQGVASLPGAWWRLRYEIPGGQYPATDILLSAGYLFLTPQLRTELTTAHRAWCNHAPMTFTEMEHVDNPK